MSRDEIIAMAREAGCVSAEFWPGDFAGLMGVFERFAALVAAKEREAIAAHYDAQPHVEFFGRELADEIRARGNHVA